MLKTVKTFLIITFISFIYVIYSSVTSIIPQVGPHGEPAIDQTTGILLPQKGIVPDQKRQKAAESKCASLCGNKDGQVAYNATSSSCLCIQENGAPQVTPMNI